MTGSTSPLREGTGKLRPDKGVKNIYINPIEQLDQLHHEGKFPRTVAYFGRILALDTKHEALSITLVSHDADLRQGPVALDTEVAQVVDADAFGRRARRHRLLTHLTMALILSPCVTGCVHSGREN